MTAGEFCNREVVIIRKEAPVLEASQRMREYHVGDVVVVEETNGERIPIGILTDRDIVIGVIARGSEYLGVLTVGDVMSTELITAQETEDLRDVLKRMCAHGIRRIPVVNEAGGLQGILSIDDILDQVCEELSDLVKLIAREQKREGEERF